MVLLSPNGPKLKSMAKKWIEVVEAGGTRRRRAHDEPHATRPRVRPVARSARPRRDREARREARRPTARRPTPPRIAFILEYDGKRVLFGADAYASVLTDGLRRYAERVGEARPRIDLVKLSHHGSNANISMDMLGLIDCRRWLISTNGDNFAHPDDAAIAKVIISAGRPGDVLLQLPHRTYQPWAEHGPGVGATFKFPKANQHSIRVTA